VLFRLLIVVGGLVSAFGVFWIYWVLVKEGRSFNFEAFCALTLLGGGFLSYIGSHDARLSLERLASGKVGTIGVSEVGSPVVRLDDAEKSIWLDV